MFEITGIIEGVVSTPSRVWEGKVVPESHQLQLLERGEQRSGALKSQVVNLSVDAPGAYADLVGKTIRVPVGFSAGPKGLSYWLYKGARPEVISVTND